MTRALYVLLAAVAAAAAVLSFAALRDLALLCGFSRSLAWLLPVVIDAGAAAGTLVWLGAAPGEPGRRFARRLALWLLGGSIAANALSHGAAAYADRRPFWVVVVACVISGVAPAVLGAVVHLVAARRRPAVGPLHLPAAPADDQQEPCPAPADVPVDVPPGDEVAEHRATRLIAAGAGRRVLARELDITEHEAKKLLRARRNGHRLEA